MEAIKKSLSQPGMKSIIQGIQEQLKLSTYDAAERIFFLRTLSKDYQIIYEGSAPESELNTPEFRTFFQTQIEYAIEKGWLPKDVNLESILSSIHFNKPSDFNFLG